MGKNCPRRLQRAAMRAEKAGYFFGSERRGKQMAIRDHLLSPYAKKPLLNSGFFVSTIEVMRWRCHPDLNRRIKVLQTFALPLGYGTVCGAVDEIRTRDIHLGKVALYH